MVAPQPFYEDRGTPIAVRQLLKALSQLGYAADLLTFPVGQGVEIPGVRVFRTPNPFGVRQVPIGFSLRKLLLDVGLVSALRERLRSTRYDCIHAVEEAAFPAVLLGRAHGIPVVYDMQSSLPEQLGAHRLLSTRAARRVTGAAERWLLRRTDKVVASAGLAARVRAQAPEARLQEWTFPSSCDPAPSADADELRRALGIDSRAPVVVYSGTFEPYQGLRTLLAGLPRIIERFPETVLVLVGADQEAGDGIVCAARKLRLERSVRVVERQPKEAVPAYLAMADVLVSARAFGGNLPLKIFDYLAAGRAIVATDIPTHRSVLDETRAVLVEPSARGLADGIVALLGDPRRARMLAAAGSRYAEDHLGWLPFVSSVEHLYTEVLASHSRAS